MTYSIAYVDRHAIDIGISSDDEEHYVTLHVDKPPVKR